MRRAFLGAVVLTLLAVGCGPAYIEGTEVVDNAVNRELLELVEHYRQAIESRDAGSLAEIVSRSYFDNASTTARTDDDYGHEQLLRDVLPVLRDNIKKVVYSIKVERAQVKGPQAAVFFEWELTCQYVEGGVEGWTTAKDRNRLDLVHEDGRWKIASGL